jgi:nucleoside-triphosphatase
MNLNIDTPARVLLTGMPGCGKTTAVKRAQELIGPDRCVGFYTEEVREKGRRVGFDVVTVDGRRGVLARAGAAGPRVSRYGVDLASFEALGVAALEAGLGERGRVLVVDEIGKMELFSRRFVEALERMFIPGCEYAVLGTVMRGRHPVVDWVRGQEGVRVIEVTLSNRDGLPGRLSEMF